MRSVGASRGRRTRSSKGRHSIPPSRVASAATMPQGGGPRGGAPAKGRSAGEEAKTPLQAVVLADSFAQRFRPITLERPKARAYTRPLLG